MQMYNLIEYNDNNSDISGSLWQRDQRNDNANVATNNSSSFKYKLYFIGNEAADKTIRNVK